MRQSVGFYGGKLAGQRQKALIYYEGLAKGDLAPPEIEGRSSVVSTEVRNVIESMLPELMAKFSSSERVVEAEPSKKGDEDNAKVITEYLNHIFYKKNNGHKILMTWFKDALISKAGIIKVWWDTRVEETREEYRGLNDVELAQLLDDEEIEPIEHSSYPDEEDEEQRQQAIQQITAQLQQAMQAAQAGDQQAAMAVQQMQAQLQQIEQSPPKVLHDLSVKRSKKGGKIAIENVPPEEFLISRKAKDIQSAPFVGHRVMRTVSELKSMGYKNVDGLTSDDNGQNWSMERIERISFDDEQPWNNTDTPTMDESQRLVWVTECYIRADRDGDGIAELLKVVRAGNELLEVETVDVIPFVHVVPIVMPHRFFGLCPADLAMEPQKIKTSILRAMLDNLYLQVNGRYFAVEGQVNLDDLLTSRPGGVVRVKNPGATGRLDQGVSDGGTAMGMLEYMQGFTEEATGWNRVANAVDNPDSLNATATAANIQSNRAQMRNDLIARNFAEGVVDLFKMMLKLVCQHQDQVEETFIDGQWVNIDPREWRNQYGFTINVGLGTGSKDQQVAHLNMQIQHQANGLQIGIATPENLYQSAKKLSEALGFKNSDQFWTDPAKQPPKPPQADPVIQVEQMKQQGEQAKIQATMQLEREKTQLEMQQAQFAAQAEASKKDAELKLQTELELLKAQHQKELEAFKIQAQQEMEWRKAQLDAETKIIVASIGAQSKEKESPEEDMAEGSEEPNTNQVLAQAMMGFQAALERIGQPRQIVRGPDGRVQGVI